MVQTASCFQLMKQRYQSSKASAKTYKGEKVQLYAIAPYAYEYVRKSTQTGGVSGLATSLAKEMIFSSNIKVIAANLGGLARFNLSALAESVCCLRVITHKIRCRQQTCILNRLCFMK